MVSEDAKEIIKSLEKLEKSIEVWKEEKKVKTADESDFLTLGEIDEHIAKKYGLREPSSVVKDEEDEEEEEW